MKTYSSDKFPETPIKWWKDQYVIFFNQKENQVDEDNAGMRYEAEMTVIENISEEAITNAVKRNLHDPDHDYAICANFEVEGQEAIKVKRDYSPELPEIRKSEIVFDHDLHKDTDTITSEKSPVDEIIKKVAGGVRNYVIQCIAGARTSNTDEDVQKLIADNNIIITAQ